jgi:hypothetical protein
MSLTRATLLTVAVLTAAGVLIGRGVPVAVHYIGHDKVTEVMSKGGPIVSDPGLVVLAQRREAGQVEYHDHTNHVFIMAEGEATLVVGGTMVDPKRTAPDQMRAPSLEGGTTYHLSNYDSGKDAPLVHGSCHKDRSLLRGEHRERIADSEPRNETPSLRDVEQDQHSPEPKCAGGDWASQWTT